MDFSAAGAFGNYSSFQWGTFYFCQNLILNQPDCFQSLIGQHANDEGALKLIHFDMNHDREHLYF